MSIAYKEAIEKNPDLTMREWCQRPGKIDLSGKPLYFTEQSHKDECDVNRIIRKYDKTGLITHINRFEGDFGDVSGLEFQNMQNRVASAMSQFEELPSKIRKRFRNNPVELLKFMDDAGNRNEAIELGLIPKSMPADKDGFGDDRQDEIVEDGPKEAA